MSFNNPSLSCIDVDDIAYCEYTWAVDSWTTFSNNCFPTHVNGVTNNKKLIRVIEGEIIDFVVDIRHGSPTFSKHISVKLSKSNYKQLFIPRGFAHGLYVTSDYAISNYKVDNYFSKDHDSGINFFDKDLDLYKQVISYKAIISQKDKNLLKLSQLDSFYKINNE